MNSNPDTESASTAPSARPRRWGRILLITLAIILLLAPWLLAKTTLRDKMLNAIFDNDAVRVQSRDASFGYLSPLSLSGLRIDAQPKALIEVEEISSDHSWLGLLISRPELGTFRFRQPHFEVTVTPPEKATTEPTDPPTEGEPTPSGDPPAFPLLVAEVTEASVLVRTEGKADPPIDIRDVSVTLRLERQDENSVFRIDPCTLFDRQSLTPELCGQGLQLIAPLLADEVSADGEFSLRLEQVQIPLANPEAMESLLRVSGEIELHRASVGLKNTAAKNVLSLIVNLLGDSLPDTMTVAEGVRVKFKVEEGRVHHEGLALILPHRDSSIELVSSGSVGMDETLDLRVSIQFPEGMLGGSKLASRLTEQPVVVAVTGTFEDPHVGLAEEIDWVQSIEGLLGNVGGEAAETGRGESSDGVRLEEALSEVVGGLLDRASERAAARAADRAQRGDEALQEGEPEAGEVARPRLRNGPLFPGLRDRLRNRREPEQETEL